MPNELRDRDARATDRVWQRLVVAGQLAAAKQELTALLVESPEGQPEVEMEVRGSSAVRTARSATRTRR